MNKIFEAYFYQMKIIKISLFLAMVLVIPMFFISRHKNAKDKEQLLPVATAQEAVAEPKVEDKRVFVEVKEGDTYGKLMDDAGVGGSMANAIYDAAKDVYDLAKVRLGKSLELVYEKESPELKELVYKIDSEDEIVVKNTKFLGQASSTTFWVSEKRPIAYEVKTVVKEGEVESSMYQAALDNNIDERAIIALADAFQWSIDFALDPRVGDKFKFVYEERYLDGKYVMPGKVLAGYYVNDGQRYETYYFHENDNNEGYFDADGNSAQKMFLKAPVSFKYISSGFTTGLRYVEAFNVSTGHRAVDYAAVKGTPIRAVGDGVVTYAGWSSVGYGNLTTIRHNGTYSTNYGHQSKILVKRGERVKQGQIIGYVGSTGFSTGPHLHYEMVKNGVKVNPLKEVLPPGQSISLENRERFDSEKKAFKEKLGLVD